jgi:hypothetical protein
MLPAWPAILVHTLCTRWNVAARAFVVVYDGVVHNDDGLVVQLGCPRIHEA